MLRKLLVFTAFPMVLSCAPFQQAAAHTGPTSEQSSLIDATCANVMGLSKGEAYYVDCKDSLTHSMARKVSAQLMGTVEQACRDKGLAEGSPALSVCMLDEESKAPPQRIVSPMQPVSLAYADGPLESGKSYYDVTPTVRWHRERYSCAQLGLIPNSGMFGECVASLDGELLPDE